MGIKYKSLLTSLFVHLFIALVITAMYMKYQERSYETRVCVNLQALHYVEPKPIKKVLPQKISKPVVKPKPIVKKKPAPLIKKKIVPVEKIVMVKEAPSEPQVAEPVVAVVEQLEEVPVEKVLLPEEQRQEAVVARAVVTSPEKVIPIVTVTAEEQYMDENLAIINALIKRNLSYPRIAKKRGLQGKAFVLFTIDKEGNIVEISASGKVSSILKKSALKTVQKASSSFPHPSQALTLQIPIVYKLH